MTFSHRLRVKVPMTDDLAAARAALAGVTTDGQTALRDAVALSLTLVQGQEARGLVLLFTDGQDNASWISDQGVIELARRADAVLHVINVDSRLTFEIDSFRGPADSSDRRARVQGLVRRRLHSARAGRIRRDAVSLSPDLRAERADAPGMARGQGAAAHSRRHGQDAARVFRDALTPDRGAYFAGSLGKPSSPSSS